MPKPLPKLPNFRRAGALAALTLLIGIQPLGAPEAVATLQQNNDHINLEQARNGCAQKDFDLFIEAFIWSAAVRAEYTAAQVEQRRFDRPGRAPGNMLPGNSEAIIVTNSHTHVWAKVGGKWTYAADPNNGTIPAAPRAANAAAAQGGSGRPMPLPGGSCSSMASR